jgi:hypothetical protein
MNTKSVISHPWLRAIAPLGLGAALLVSPAPALGADPVHVNFSESYEDEICGIPVSVLFEGQWTNTEFIDNDGNYLFRGTASFTSTYTAANGKAVIVSDANQLTFSDPLIDEGAGTITFVNTLRGVLEKMKLANGRVLFVDAGYATDAITFDLETEEFISFEHLVFHGRDPLADSGFTLWCEAFTEALA